MTHHSKKRPDLDYVDELISFLQSRNTKLPEEKPVLYPGFRPSGPFALPEQVDADDLHPKRVMLQVLKYSRNAMSKLNVYREAVRVTTSKPFQLFLLDSFWWLFLDHCAGVDLVKLRRQRETGVMQTKRQAKLGLAMGKPQSGGGGDGTDGDSNNSSSLLADAENAALLLGDDDSETVLRKSYSVKRRNHAKRHAADDNNRYLPAHLYDDSDTESVSTNASSTAGGMFGRQVRIKKATLKRERKERKRREAEEAERAKRLARSRSVAAEAVANRNNNKNDQQQHQQQGVTWSSNNNNNHNNNSKHHRVGANGDDDDPSRIRRSTHLTPPVIFRDCEWRRSTIHLALAAAPAARSIEELQEALSGDVLNEIAYEQRGGGINNDDNDGDDDQGDDNDDDYGDGHEATIVDPNADAGDIVFASSTQRPSAVTVVDRLPPIQQSSKQQQHQQSQPQITFHSSHRQSITKLTAAQQNKQTARSFLNTAASMVFDPRTGTTRSNSLQQNSMASFSLNPSASFNAGNNTLNNNDCNSSTDSDDDAAAMASVSSGASSMASSVRTVDDVLRIRHFGPSQPQYDLHSLPPDVRRQIVAREQHVLFTRMAENYVAAMQVKSLDESRHQDALIRVLPDLVAQFFYAVFHQAIPCFRGTSETREFQCAIYRSCSYWLGGVEREVANPFRWPVHQMLGDKLYQRKRVDKKRDPLPTAVPVAGAQERRLAITKSFARRIQTHTGELTRQKKEQQQHIDHLARKHHTPFRPTKAFSPPAPELSRISGIGADVSVVSASTTTESQNANNNRRTKPVALGNFAAPRKIVRGATAAAASQSEGRPQEIEQQQLQQTNTPIHKPQPHPPPPRLLQAESFGPFMQSQQQAVVATSTAGLATSGMLQSPPSASSRRTSILSNDDVASASSQPATPLRHANSQSSSLVAHQQQQPSQQGESDAVNNINNTTKKVRRAGVRDRTVSIDMGEMIRERIESEVIVLQDEMKRAFINKKKISVGNNNNDPLLSSSPADDGSSSPSMMRRGSAGSLSGRDLKERALAIRAGAGLQRRKSQRSLSITIEERERSAGTGLSIFSADVLEEQAKERERQERNAANERDLQQLVARQIAGGPQSVTSAGSSKKMTTSASSSSSYVGGSTTSARGGGGAPRVMLSGHIQRIREKLDSRVKSVPWYGKSNQRVDLCENSGGLSTANFLLTEMSPLFQRFAASRAKITEAKSAGSNASGGNSSGPDSPRFTSYPVRPPAEIRGSLRHMRWTVAVAPVGIRKSQLQHEHSKDEQRHQQQVKDDSASGASRRMSIVK